MIDLWRTPRPMAVSLSHLCGAINVMPSRDVDPLKSVLVLWQT